MMGVNVAIKQFVKINFESVRSGRTLARIFHGISTPKFTAFEWFSEC